MYGCWAGPIWFLGPISRFPRAQYGIRFQKVLYFENFEKGLIHTQNLRKIQENTKGRSGALSLCVGSEKGKTIIHHLTLHFSKRFFWRKYKSNIAQLLFRKESSTHETFTKLRKKVVFSKKSTVWYPKLMHGVHKRTRLQGSVIDSLAFQQEVNIDRISLKISKKE